MAERRKEREKDDKQKSQISQSSQPQSLRVLPTSMSQAKYEPPSQIVPFPGCSPIQISNRFANLGAIVGQVRPSFQSALISSHDPFQDIAITNPPVVSYQKTSPYMVNWETSVLSRQFSIKWWDKFKLERIADYVYADFPPVKNPHSKKKSSPATSHSSLPIEGRSKSELQDLARQLMLQASQMNDDADSDASPASQTSTSQPKLASQTPAPKMRWSDYPDEHDPYDFGLSI
ncbi:hypothetical protein L3X38_001707 [Prunus dulcis]|uniref:Uncharacterized protein n=1 Tax=Prunus dulcis TaxID=3755 RepID=A0AAD4ZK37_PRUDU|nr:hypothetical protein L3X38_001707 [Prunus dulcis]